MAAPPHLLRLPVELHLSIIDKLAFEDNINLAFTNRYFCSIVKPPTHRDYLIAEEEDWAKNKELFACGGCARFRRFKEFADDMKKGRRSRGGINANARLCLACGVLQGLYSPGTSVLSYGKHHMLCRLCKTFTEHFTYKGTCTKCSPRSRVASTSSADTPQRQYAPEHTSNRSAMIYYDRTLEDELYCGPWADRYNTSGFLIMVSFKKVKESQSTPSRIPHRSQQLIQCLSSGFSSVLKSIPRRRGSTATQINRPQTAPTPNPSLKCQAHCRQYHPEDSPQLCVPQIDIPRISAPDGCPYNKTYHTFPDIERKPCILCGLRPLSRAASPSSRPCRHYRSRSPFSHIVSGFRHSSHGWSRNTTAVHSSLGQLLENASPDREGIRTVPAVVSVSKIGNLPRRAALPFRYIPSYSRTSEDLRGNSKTSSINTTRPVSPKIHHIRGLSGRKTPYIHKHEFDAHVAALRAGSPSPLYHNTEEPISILDPTRTYSYSYTVWYGTQSTRAYRRHPRDPTRPPLREADTDDSFSTLTTQNPTHVGGRRLELKGGSACPRLRGGDDMGCGFKEAGDRCVSTISCLRGGAREDERLSATLYWLAGGRGKAVTVGGWKKMRGKKRMGGLIGMAVHGVRAGVEYSTGIDGGVEGLEEKVVSVSSSASSRANNTSRELVENNASLVGDDVPVTLAAQGDEAQNEETTG
ncbi:hypothetical protein GQ44DRAFT_615152 [Phaeosphaeriaceae sp. PMI808]|nr:hypothetical protein GQ44DRAFT_615152 [Phaeosphaeriaceae sp. PMI808]